MPPAKATGGHYKYTVIAGTPEKMLEHCLETRIEISTSLNNGGHFGSAEFGDGSLYNGSGSTGYSSASSTIRGQPSCLASILDPNIADTFLEDLLLTRAIYMPTPVSQSFN